jgi:hypothetical protein
MLVIRNAQLAAFEAVRVREFTQKLEAYLRATLPEVCARLGDDGVSRRLEDTLAQGARFGIESERDMAAFARWVMFPRPSFESDPEARWIVEILKRPWPATTRMELIERKLEARP